MSLLYIPYYSVAHNGAVVAAQEIRALASYIFLLYTIKEKIIYINFQFKNLSYIRIKLYITGFDVLTFRVQIIFGARGTYLLFSVVAALNTNTLFHIYIIFPLRKLNLTLVPVRLETDPNHLSALATSK